MKVVLVAVNSKFIHSNLAVRYLESYTRDLDYTCVIREFSVNDRREKILEELINEQPDILAFSCYIWNVELIESLARLVKLVNPKIKIAYGGPEVSYESMEFLTKNVGEYVICGEGEETYRELMQYEIYQRNLNENDTKKNLIKKLRNIKGLCFKYDECIQFNGERPLMDISKIVFPYRQDDNLENKIIYFESSRGCPFKCKYCLSAATHGVKFLDVDRVKNEIKFLISKDVKLIKFLDRTFNCSPRFAMDIWKFLIDLDTTATFHFEISADILTKEELELLSKAPDERFQFEIGVQTTNNQVLKNIDRYVRFEDIREKVQEIKKWKNIKQHLDLIAGLPGEDFTSFKKSFNDVYLMEPEEIQLGFLKLLKGSPMKLEADNWDMVYSPYTPYEILKTKHMSYDDIVLLKRIEVVLDKYYNSGKFKNILKYFIPKFETPFDFYYSLGMFFQENGYLNRNISSVDYYKVFIEFNDEILMCDSFHLSEIIKFDYLTFNMKKWLPNFLSRDINKNLERNLKNAQKKNSINIPYKSYHLENFKIDILKFSHSGMISEGNFYLIFDENNSNNIDDITYIINNEDVLS